MAQLKDTIIHGTLSVTAGSGITTLLDFTYPVGSTYTTTSSVNPSNTLGGTWELIESHYVDTGWQNFTYTNPTYIGTSQNSYTRNMWKVTDGVLYIHVGVGATATINTSEEAMIAKIPIVESGYTTSSTHGIWNGAVGGSGVFGGFVVRSTEESASAPTHLSIWLKPHTDAKGATASWYSSYFAVPLNSSATIFSSYTSSTNYTEANFDKEYKWKRIS